MILDMQTYQNINGISYKSLTGAKLFGINFDEIDDLLNFKIEFNI